MFDKLDYLLPIVFPLEYLRIRHILGMRWTNSKAVEWWTAIQIIRGSVPLEKIRREKQK